MWIIYIVMRYGVTIRRGSGLDIGFIVRLQVVTINNYDTIANFHTI
jgi:hypothetical protein